MAYRVIQWGTGNVGLFALRCLIEHPQIELAGVWVHSAEKAGRDAGELCGTKPTGVRATNDVDALLASDADCVCYTATADLRPFEAIQDICRILAAGKNVVSSSVVPLVHPKSFIPNLREQLEEACRTGGSSFFTSGIDPGFANDLLPLTLSGLSATWHEMRVLEIINATTTSRRCCSTMGWQAARRHAVAAPQLLESLGRHRADPRRRPRRQVDGSARPARSGDQADRIGAHTIEPGTAAMRFSARHGRRPAAIVEHVTSTTARAEWPTGSGSCGVISGFPKMLRVRVRGRAGDRAVGGVVLTTRIVNDRRSATRPRACSRPRSAAGLKGTVPAAVLKPRM